MREGWEIRSLGDLAVKITDGSHNPPKGIEQSEYLMLSSQNVWNGYLDKSIARHLSKQDFLVEDKRTCAREGDVLLTIVGTIGRTCVLSREDKNITFQRSVCIIKPKPGLNPFFLSYQLQFKNKEINEQANGAAQKGFYLKQVERLPLFITSLPEQQRIVDILDREFAKIDTLKANAEKSLQAAKDLFQAALTHYFSGGSVMLGDILNLHRGYDLTHSEMADGPIPVAGSGGIIGYHNVATPISPCITIGRSGSVGKVFVYETCWAHNTSLYVDDFKGNNPFYLVYLLKSLDLPSFGGGSAVPTLNRNVLHPIVVGYTPDKIEQEKIVLKLDDLNDKSNTLQQNYQNTLSLCDDLKQSLLRKAFNGEL